MSKILSNFRSGNGNCQNPPSTSVVVKEARILEASETVSIEKDNDGPSGNFTIVGEFDGQDISMSDENQLLDEG
uniref:Uncharacterized protein n=1 Tax=Megaselia scalaris TaxID=36166 RepID=T1GGM2_MEGSC